MTRTTRTTLAALALAAVLLPAGAVAHSGATGVVKERMALMKEMGDGMKRLSAMLHGEAPYDAAAVRKEAEAIAARGGEAMLKGFPPGSLDHPTEALPAIWSEPERFRALAEEVTRHAEALAAAADHPDAGKAMAGHPHTPDMDAAMGNPSMQAMMGGAPSMHQMMGGDAPAAPAAATPQAAFMQLTHTCGACHDTYRAKTH